MANMTNRRVRDRILLSGETWQTKEKHSGDERKDLGKGED